MRIAIAVLALTSTVALPARADRPASSGPYAEFGVGATRFIGDQKDDAAMGVAGNLHIGLDVFSWLSIGGRLGLSTHEATVPPPPEGEYFQLYHASGEMRLALRLSWLELFADGSFGGVMISTNVLEKVGTIGPGERLASIITAGGGLEYQLQNRHYALGLRGEWAVMPGFDRATTVSGRVYLRYTY